MKVETKLETTKKASTIVEALSWTHPCFAEATRRLCMLRYCVAKETWARTSDHLSRKLSRESGASKRVCIKKSNN